MQAFDYVYFTTALAPAGITYLTILYWTQKIRQKLSLVEVAPIKGIRFRNDRGIERRRPMVSPRSGAYDLEIISDELPT